MITIVDYGMGNLGSVVNMFKRIGVKAIVTSSLDEIGKADKVLLPGVGAFDTAMRRIREAGMRDVLDHKAKVEKIPVLGICLGMQLLMNGSEEGVEPGLGWIAGNVRRFSFDDPSLKVPHMGWNQVIQKGDCSITANLPDEPRFYFVHSYYVQVDNENDCVTKTFYGHEFDSIVQHGNIFGAQFHPEKSHRFGMKLLENFSKI